jgi:hypothetical protein
MIFIKEFFSITHLGQYWYIAAIIIFYIIKLLYKFFHDRNRQNREDLDKLISYYEKPKGLQEKFVLELLLQNCFGSILSKKEFMYFDSLEDSLKNLRSYLSCKEYVGYDSDNNRLFLKKNNLIFRIYGWLSSYFVFAMLSLWLVFTTIDTPEKTLNFGVIMIITGVVSFAFLSLIQYMNASTARKLYINIYN